MYNLLFNLGGEDGSTARFGARRAHHDGTRRTRGMSAIYLAAAIVLEICGTTSLKLSDGFTRIGPAGAVVISYVASFALLSLALRGIELSIAYAVWSGVGTAVVAAIGILWFGESAGAWKLLCLVLVVLGVAGLHLSERAP
jgi:small multidrug resistance pump